MTDNLEAAKFYHDTIIVEMEGIRKIADELETFSPAGLLPYPSYEEMLFSV